MALFGKKEPKLPFDPARQEAAVRRSICTGEMTLGFVDRETGKFLEYQLARDQRELEDFCKRAGVSPERIKTIY